MAFALLIAGLAARAAGLAPECAHHPSIVDDEVFTSRVVVADEVMGARAVVAGDLDNDGDQDLVSASSTDNTVAWYENLGNRTFSRKRALTYDAKGARIVTLGDIDSDGFLDVVFASYYDNTVGWFKNDQSGGFGDRLTISASVDEGQGVVAADLDGDGDLDVAAASSGDHSVAWFENMGQGRFCEIKNVVDDDAQGARTVIAADLDGDGRVDLAGASKDDNTIAVYLSAEGFAKRVVNGTALGAYSLVAVDLDRDGDQDLVTASNGDDTVAWYENDGSGTRWTFHEIYAEADFVLSVAAADFDRDGDVDVASASFFDGAIRWYENRGDGAWLPHDVRVVPGTQGHYVFAADADADGDQDLLAATHAENTLAVYYASTACDAGPREACCRIGERWDGQRCAACPTAQYGVSEGVCEPCPRGCAVPGLAQTPKACVGITGCARPFLDELADCTCGADAYLAASDTCASCPDGQNKPAPEPRDEATYEAEGRAWDGFNETGCVVGDGTAGGKVKSVRSKQVKYGLFVALGILAGSVVATALALAAMRAYQRLAALRRGAALHEAETARRLLHAMATPSECRYTVCFLSYAEFRAAGEIRSHERLRRKLVHLDDHDDIVAFCERVPTCFVSHQWLGLKHPDPTGVHFNSIIAACDALCARYDLDPKRLYLWVDYVSVPQKNKVLQQLSIGSITVYASVCRYFLIVAPTTRNADTDAVCDATTYQERGWCRLEQFARIASGGLRNMCLFDDVGLWSIKDNERWYQDSCEVYQAHFTYEEDKEKIVETFLGLYAILLVNKNDGDNPKILRLIEARRNHVFPERYFSDLPARLEREIAAVDPATPRRSSSPILLSEDEISTDATDMKKRVTFLRSFSTAPSGLAPSLSVRSTLRSLTSALGDTLAGRLGAAAPAPGDGWDDADESGGVEAGFGEETGPVLRVES